MKLATRVGALALGALGATAQAQVSPGTSQEAPGGTMQEQQRGMTPEQRRQMQEMHRGMMEEQRGQGMMRGPGFEGERGPTATMRRSREAMSMVNQAWQALRQNDTQRAMMLLDRSEMLLRQIYVGTPAGSIARRIDQIGVGFHMGASGSQEGMRPMGPRAEYEEPGMPSGTMGQPGMGEREPTGGRAGQEMGGQPGQEEMGRGSGGQAGQEMGRGYGGQAGQEMGRGFEGQEMGRDITTELAPLVAEVQRLAVYLDPEVVARVREAQQRANAGDQQGAFDSLRMARQALAADIALLPVEDAYARVAAARAELQRGQVEFAQRLLASVPIAIARLEASAPLVPIRFDLRAAAAAAEQGSWERARMFVGRASNHLQALRSFAGVEEPGFARAISSLTERVNTLQQRIAAGARPSPGEIRDLAQRTRYVG